MVGLLDRLENFCKMNNIDLDGVLKTFDEPQQIDNIDVKEKHNAKMQILKNVFKHLE